MRFNVRWAALGAAVAVVAVAAAAALAATGGGTVKAVHNGRLGTVLVTAGGMTLYHYTDDKGGKVACVGGCATSWPPLVVRSTAKLKAGAGVDAARLATVKRPDGSLQVTYAGFPLYRYAGDKKPGDAKGQGVETSWFAVTSRGTLAKALPKAPAKKAPPIQTTTNDGGGYGY